MAGLLRGLKVIESAVLYFAPPCGQLLADEGANVVKLESPFKGDYARDVFGQIMPHKSGHSPVHMLFNRNKRSVAVDLKSSEGKEIFFRMLQGADVFLDGNAAGVMDRLGLGYEAQRKVKPDIVYAHMTGFGATGPYAMLPEHGAMAMAVTGKDEVHMTENGAEPIEGSPNTITTCGEFGLYLAYAITAALYKRAATGQSVYIDIGHTDICLGGTAGIQIVRRFNADRIGVDATGSTAGEVMGANSKYNFYQTKDGKFLQCALIEHHFYERFCKGVGREDLLADDVGFVTKSVPMDWGPTSLRPKLQEVFHTRTLAEWIQFAVENRLPICPANSALEILDDPHIKSREQIIEYIHPTVGPVVMPGNPIKVQGERFEVYRGAPALGQHTNEYLKELGYDEKQLDELEARGVIRNPTR